MTSGIDMKELASLKDEILNGISAANDLESLDQIRLEVLGKKGKLTSLMKNLGQMTGDERREMGQELNRVKDSVVSSMEDRRLDLQKEALEARLAFESVDVTQTTRPEQVGCIHPTHQTIAEVTAIFNQMGFVVAGGPDIENDDRNFNALNIPESHPARDMHDTFYLPDDEKGERKVLRTHTSIRTMRSQKPPIKIVVPGRAFRSDYDMTHTPMFHQIEGLVIDKTSHLGHLKGCLVEFLKIYFGVDDLPVRFRPSYFPFTEPSMEVDIGCSRKGGDFKIGAGDQWLEILGCVMVHPKVLENCGLDPEEYQGFAFGMGIERIAMLKHGIPDLRSFFESDLRWLRHYGFRTLDVPSVLKGLES